MKYIVCKTLSLSLLSKVCFLLLNFQMDYTKFYYGNKIYGENLENIQRKDLKMLLCIKSLIFRL